MLESYKWRTSVRVGAALAAIAVLGIPALVAQAPNPLAVRAVRFYRADGRKTIVKAFVEVPAQLAEPVAAGRTDSLRYEVALRVQDSAGVTLHSETWGKTLANEPGAAGVDIVEFVVPAGKYRLEATVSAAGQRKAQSAVDVEGYDSMPAASDLLLAPMMRVVDATDTVPQPGTIRRGNTVIAATAMLDLTPLRPRAFYLLEAYNGTELDETGSMKVAVMDSAGHALTETKPVPVRIGPGGGMLQGQVDLEGLPEGRYMMTVAVDLNGKTVVRSGPLNMAPLETTVARNAEVVQAAMVGDEGYFSAMSDAALDSAAAPLIYLANSNERSLVRGFAKLSPQAKRRFLTEFWKKRDPDPASERNEVRERFYDAIAFANRSFSEGTRNPQAGWRTDRGRVYAKNGAPDDVLRRPMGATVPFEVWQYTHGKSRYYIFADRTGIGAFNLLATNDLTEQRSFPGWREIIGPDALTEISRYLGVDFFSGDQAGS